MIEDISLKFENTLYSGNRSPRNILETLRYLRTLLKQPFEIKPFIKSEYMEMESRISSKCLNVKHFRCQSYLESKLWSLRDIGYELIGSIIVSLISFS